MMLLLILPALRQFPCHNLHMLKPALQIRLGQQLTMTPQLQQAIRLLQLSSLELKVEIQEAFESNPMLETDEEHEPEHEITERLQAEDDPDVEEIMNNETLPDELLVDSQWDDIYEPSYPPITNYQSEGYWENRSGAENDSLQQHLLWQLELSSLSDQDHVVAITLVDALDESGYLQETLESIHQNLIKDYAIELDEIEAVLKFVQRLDPIGSGARNLQECLDIQLQQMAGDTPFLSETRSIVEKHLDLVGTKNYKQLIKLTKLTVDEIENAITLIQSLYPKPGNLINAKKSEYIVPDVTLYKYEGIWRVKLNSESAPKLRINDVYSKLVKNSGNNSEANYMRHQLQEARWLIKSLQNRNETLLQVTTSIVKHQKNFFEYGEEAMRPLVLRDIAEELDMHESTISRATSNKYMASPRGVFELKYFFSSHVNTNDGGMCSATAIKAMIKNLIKEENQAKPFSDSEIAALLERKGISVARRTIAKYREAMAILPSNKRKQIA